MLRREEVTDIGEEIYISQDFNKAKGARIQSAGENTAQSHNSFFNIFLNFESDMCIAY